MWLDEATEQLPQPFTRLPEAINAVFPETIIQTCVVHLIRHSLEFVSWKVRKPVCRRIEALNAKLRRAVKIRGHFPNGDAATKLIYLILRQTAAEWKMSPREWGEAKTQFAIVFEDRFVLA